MSVTVKSFGTCLDGGEISLYTITNKRGMQVSVANIGAALVKVMVPDREGRLADVVLGFDKGEDYLKNPCFMGTVVGPSANRIAGGCFSLEGKDYELDVNDGENNLHSHREKGWHKRLWEAVPDGSSVTFTLKDGDGSMGFPGEKQVSVTYLLDEENALTIHYHGSSDCRTIFNPTNHSYFNLEGHNAGSIADHELWLGASRYTPTGAGSIPTGELADVKGTPMDFTVGKKVGAEIDADFPQLKLAGGYDHNWVIDCWDGTLRHFATLKAPVSGRIMEAYTTLPGVQFYAGNYIEEQVGKDGALYDYRCALCLETQYFPDSVHNPRFPSCIFGKGDDYDSVTVFRFC